jgi:tRNA(Ile)-lysidine synthase
MAAGDARGRLYDAVRRALLSLPSDIIGVAIALSGGRDSLVLLHVVADVLAESEILPGAGLRAIHVHHGLQPPADEWAAFCDSACVARGIPIDIQRIDATPPPGESPEAWARQCRYQALASALHDGEALLTAHHQLDQAETVLLQLLRGAGPSGLAAMPRLRRFHGGWHLRPLLDVDVDDIEAFAVAQALAWVDDPSNRDRRFDRNYLRHEILPRLRQRWPAAARCIARTAVWQAAAAEALVQQSAQRLPSLQSADGRAIRIDSLQAMVPEAQATVLRAWIQGNGRPLPSAAQLEQLLRLIGMRADATPCVRWASTEVRRHRGQLIIMASLPLLEAGMQVAWDAAAGPLPLPFGVLSGEAASGPPLVVRYRRGGEACRVRPGGPTRPVKHLLQEWGVPAWLRAGLPLVYADDELVAIGDRRTSAAVPEIRLRWDWQGDVGVPPGWRLTPPGS